MLELASLCLETQANMTIQVRKWSDADWQAQVHSIAEFLFCGQITVLFIYTVAYLLICARIAEPQQPISGL
jgi:hypothetical protein